MFKNLSIALLISCCSLVTFAQPTLTAANFNPVIGDAFGNIICDTTGITAGSGGAAVTWNFSALISTSVDTGAVTACASTPHCSLFPGSTYAIISQATHLIPYYIAGAAALSQNGYYIASDTNAVYSDPIDQFHYPFTMGTTFSDPYAGILTLGSITAQETGTITVTCDGYGTLELPGSIDSNALRVHTVQLFTDSASLFGFPTVQTFQLETYSWYKTDYHSPLMTILNTTQVGGSYTNKAVSYSPRQVSTSATTLSGTGPALLLYPTPATNELNVQYYCPTNQRVRITLCDVTGRQVALIADRLMYGTNTITCNTTMLPKGLYLLHLQAGTETITRKVVI